MTMTVLIVFTFFYMLDLEESDNTWDLDFFDDNIPVTEGQLHSLACLKVVVVNG